MKFKATLSKEHCDLLKGCVKTMYKFVRLIEKKNASAYIQFTPTTMNILVKGIGTDEFQAWCSLPKNFSECICISKRENKIGMEVDLLQLSKAVESLDSSFGDTIMHLSRRIGRPILCLDFAVSGSTGVCISTERETAVEILLGENVHNIVPPRIRIPPWQVGLNKPKNFLTVLERLMQIGVEETVLFCEQKGDPASTSQAVTNNHVTLHVSGSCEESVVRTSFKNCVRYSIGDDEFTTECPPTKFKIRKLAGVLSLACSVSEKVVLCLLPRSLIVIYVAAVNDAAIQFFVPAVDD